jgi:hypothetical protein
MVLSIYAFMTPEEKKELMRAFARVRSEDGALLRIRETPRSGKRKKTKKGGMMITPFFNFGPSSHRRLCGIQHRHVRFQAGGPNGSTERPMSTVKTPTLRGFQLCLIIPYGQTVSPPHTLVPI